MAELRQVGMMLGKTLQEILDESSRDHAHLCPRQVLGARMGQAGMSALGFDNPPPGKRLLIIAETDGCFLDGLSAATGCTPGHRTLRIEDYGKTAAVFADSLTSKTMRIAPRLDIRARANTYAPNELRHYFAQMQAYGVMPLEEMFTTTSVCLKTSIEVIVSRPRVRTSCALCGEEIINERAVQKNGIQLCRTCANGGYYSTLESIPIQLAEAQ